MGLSQRGSCFFLKFENLGEISMLSAVAFCFLQFRNQAILKAASICFGRGRLPRFDWKQLSQSLDTFSSFPLLPSKSLISFLSLIHISEPTRPLYISYAVFCLKKKKTNANPKHIL
eukprot:TRINITY_DN53160_c0_g1_i1.p2 TRINITY_DN53160_c0_g1~~TRINITY_DN53160_c0_g1_i1.p2  ORF type:complete len:116 (-),score=15.31 TRINITY_DN53160_c0_g1_i1:71-418(-)